jgi:hypothetical protein
MIIPKVSLWHTNSFILDTMYKICFILIDKSNMNHILKDNMGHGRIF